MDKYELNLCSCHTAISHQYFIHLRSICHILRQSKKQKPIYLGIGANLPDGFDGVKDALRHWTVRRWGYGRRSHPGIKQRSAGFRSAVVPERCRQVDTDLDAAALMAVLHDRESGLAHLVDRNGARVTGY